FVAPVAVCVPPPRAARLAFEAPAISAAFGFFAVSDCALLVFGGSREELRLNARAGASTGELVDGVGPADAVDPAGRRESLRWKGTGGAEGGHRALEERARGAVRDERNGGAATSSMAARRRGSLRRVAGQPGGDLLDLLGGAGVAFVVVAGLVGEVAGAGA